MSVSPLNDLVVKLKTGCLGRKQFVYILKSNLTISLVSSLFNLGLISAYEVEPNSFYIKVFLKFFENSAVIKNIVRVSKPSRRIYSSSSLLRNHFKYKRKTFLFLTTSQGILSKDEALALNVGGEVLLEVFV
jgi:small subunit ribosomal protein S8